MITGLAPPSADVDPPAPADAPDASEPDDAEPARPGWLPAPRATAVAILSMLAFGVLAGSLVKPEAESLARTYVVAMPPAATTPARRRRPTQARRRMAAAVVAAVVATTLSDPAVGTGRSRGTPSTPVGDAGARYEAPPCRAR